MSEIAGIGSLAAGAVQGVTPAPTQQPTLVEQKIEQAAGAAGQSASAGSSGGGGASPLSEGTQATLLQAQEVGGASVEQVQAGAAATDEQTGGGLTLGDVIDQIT
jgi:hypothetical protein|tara:strand:+ start:279 stop:593 length:315 start_codon:yes stop_codon:yes gene_type:complete